MKMKKNYKKKRLNGIFLILVFFSLLGLISAQDTSQLKGNPEKVTIYFFWGEDCPHCESQKPYLEEWQEKYGDKIEVKSFETWKNKGNLVLFQEAAAAYGIQARGVPTTFIGEKHWVGFSSLMALEMESYIQECIENGCESPLDYLNLEKKYEEKINELCLHIFVKESCSQCEGIIPYIETLEEKYEFEIKKYDVSYEGNETLFNQFKENYGLKAEMYPTVFIGESYISGEESIRTAIESEIENCLDSGCSCPLRKVNPHTPINTDSKDVSFEEEQTIKIPFFGEVDLSSMSLVVVTALIGFVDGFNPCSLWVLTFLLGIVIYTGSRKKIAIVGLTFLIVTTLAYGLFMVGLLNVFKYVGYLGWIQFVVALIAGVFALVNIKDYFWYKKGISFTISDKHKPKIFKKVRNIMKGEGSVWALISGTALMALGIVLIELPCTAGFPVIWTNLVADNNVNGTSFLLLLLLYLGIYLLDELVVFGTVAFTLKASKFEEKHGRILKLIGGMIMLALAIVLIFKPELMNDLGGALLIFAISIAISFLIMWIHRKVLPKYGIKIGTEAIEHKKIDKEEINEEKNKESNLNSDEKRIETHEKMQENTSKKESKNIKENKNN
jgi:thiol-disulfide isomerase/thioredoxin